AYATLALPPPSMRAVTEYQIAPKPDRRLSIQGWTPQKAAPPNPHTEISTGVAVPFTEGGGSLRKHPLAVVPAYSVTLEPGTQVVPTAGSTREVRVGVSYNLSSPAQGVLHLTVPQGWKVAPAEVNVRFAHRGEKQDFDFTITPSQLKEGRTEVRAVLQCGGQQFSEGYTVVTRDDLNTFYYYQPAVQRVSIVDVQIPKELKVGYIKGAGDDIATVLR